MSAFIVMFVLVAIINLSAFIGCFLIAMSIEAIERFTAFRKPLTRRQVLEKKSALTEKEAAELARIVRGDWLRSQHFSAV
jgi:hypothetical protein